MNKHRCRVLTLLLAAAILLLACGCGKTEDQNTAASSYEHVVDILNTVWESTSQDFPAFGGNFENNVDNAPGELNLDDHDTMTNMLLIPEDVQSHITEAATLFHMMNTNTFTGAAIRLDGMDAAEAAGKLKDAFKNNQFMCGIPDKIIVYSVGNDLVYFYGAADVLAEFQTAAENLEGAALIIDENY